MFYYAHLNDNNIVINISAFESKITNDTHPETYHLLIAIDKYDLALLGKKWNGKTFVLNDMDMPPAPMSFAQAQAVMLANSHGLTLTMEQVAQAQSAILFEAQKPPVQDGQAWEPGLSLAAGTIVTRNGQYWVVNDGMGHISQTGWEPESTPALFTEIREDFAPWSQPAGAHDAYMRGDKVTHGGAKWVSDIDGNIWPPGVHGWTLLS